MIENEKEGINSTNFSAKNRRTAIDIIAGERKEFETDREIVIIKIVVFGAGHVAFAIKKVVSTRACRLPRLLLLITCLPSLQVSVHFLCTTSVTSSVLPFLYSIYNIDLRRFPPLNIFLNPGDLARVPSPRDPICQGSRRSHPFDCNFQTSKRCHDI